MKVQWTTPKDGGAILKSYTVNFQDGNGEFRTYDNCVPSVATSCQFDLITFLNEFNLKSGDNLMAQVTAYNLHGASEPSLTNEPITIPQADQVSIVAIE